MNLEGRKKEKGKVFSNKVNKLRTQLPCWYFFEKEV